MPIDAVALVRIPLDAVKGALGDEVEELTFESPRGPVALEPLHDAVRIHLGVRFDSEPADVGIAVRHILGDAADLHSDERGVYVYPDIARSRETTYDAVLEDMGEGGMWVPLASAEDARLGADETMGLFDAVQGMMGGDLLGQVQAALSDPGGDAMQSLAGLASQLLENPELRQSVQSAAEKLMAGGQLPGEVAGDSEGLLAQASSIASQVAGDNPELLAQIAAKMGSGEEE
ncbi:MAG: hypothetical protein AAGE52_05455 [Myxococcota bacterium]